MPNGSNNVRPFAQSEATFIPDRAPFGFVPWGLLDQMPQPRGKQRICVYLALQRHQQMAGDGVAISAIAAATGVKGDDVRAAIRWLSEEGWLVRIDRPGEASVYQARF